jgi:hypothetical protein
MTERFTCSIRKKEFTGGSNNTQPVNPGRYCDDCDQRVVIPARIQSGTPKKIQFLALAPERVINRQALILDRLPRKA